MPHIESLIQKLEQSGNDVFWQGGASQKSIDKLASMLKGRFPMSFRKFLLSHGGGGVVEEEISGIEDDNPELIHRGTIYGDTLRCREDFELPENLIVIYLGAGEDVVWCLDISRFSGDECPVVSFDIYSKTARLIADNFEDFLAEYLTVRISRGN